MKFLFFIAFSLFNCNKADVIVHATSETKNYDVAETARIRSFASEAKQFYAGRNFNKEFFFFVL